MSKVTDIVFEMESPYSSPDQCYDVSRNKLSCVDSDITYAKVSSSDLYVARLNGTSSLITTTSAWSPSSGFSVVAWVNPVAGYGSATQENKVWVKIHQMHINSANGYTKFRVYAAGTNSFADDTAALSTGAWHFLVGTYDTSDSKARFYKDTTLVATGAATVGTLTDISGEDMEIGGTAAVTRWFGGDIGKLRVIDRTLSHGEIVQTFEAERALFGV